MTKELQITKPAEQALAVREQPTAGDMLHAILTAIKSGEVTAEKVAAMDGAMQLCERMQNREAEKHFAAAFVELQHDMPVITAKTVIPNRGKYEKFEDVMNVVGPLLSKHGFTVSFTNDFKENRIIETCHLRHIGGHSQSNSFAVRVGRADTETQADCKAATTAKRNALLNCLNIVVRQDVLTDEYDAAIEGDPNAKVTPEQAFELERRAKETNSNIAAFLDVAKAKSFADIPANRYDEMDRLLARKEKRGR